MAQILKIWQEMKSCERHLFSCGAIRDSTFWNSIRPISSTMFWKFVSVTSFLFLSLGFKANFAVNVFQKQPYRQKNTKKIIPLLFPKMNMIERKHLHHVSDNNNVVSNEKGNIHTTTLPLYICNSVGREARPLKKKRNTRHFRAKKV